MSLIKQIHEATESGALVQPFTVADLKYWIEKMRVVKDDGNSYAASSINAILSNSNRKNRPTSNLNVKLLNSRRNGEGKYEYWF